MAQSSVLSLPFIFWPKTRTDLRHDITVLAGKADTLVSGSDTGDLVFWRSEGLRCVPRIIATPDIGLECTQIVFITPPFQAILNAEVWVLSLHSDNRLRVWDAADGRCVSISPKSMFQSESRLTRLRCIQGRLVAVCGLSNTVHIVDAWSMAKLSSYQLSGTFVDMCTDTCGKTTHLIVLCDRGEAVLWVLEDALGFLINDESTKSINCCPVASSKIRMIEPPKRVAIALDLDICAFACENLVYFVRESGVESNQLHREGAEVTRTLCLSSPIIDLAFNETHFVLLLDCQLLAIYSIEDIWKSIQFEAGRERFGFQELVAIPMVGQLNFRADSMLLSQELIHFPSANSILSYDLNSVVSLTPQSVLSSLTLHSVRSPSFADTQLHHLLISGETVTESYLSLTQAWPIHILGTSSGRVFAISLSKATAVRCFDSGLGEPISSIILVGNKDLVTATESGVLQTWKIALSSRILARSGPNVIYETKPAHVFRVANSAGLKLFPLNNIQEIIEDVKKGLWQDQWTSWQEVILVQAKDSSISLVSLEDENVLWTFYGVSGKVTEVFVHILLDYLLILTLDGFCHIINLSTQYLERICPISDIPYRSLGRTKIPIVSQDLKTRKSLSHQLLDFNLLGFTSQSCRNLTWAEYPVIGGIQIPAMCLHIANIRDSFSTMVEFPAQAEFILSLLNCWKTASGERRNLLPEEVADLMMLTSPSEQASPGTFGVEDAISFFLPGNGGPWSVSGYLSSVLSMSLLAVLDACSQFKPSLKSNFKEVVKTHLKELKRKMPDSKEPTTLVLSCEALSGDEVAYHLLLSACELLSPDLKQNLISSWLELYNSCKTEEKSDNLGSSGAFREVGKIEALSLLNVTALCGGKKKQLQLIDVNKVVDTLIYMLRQAETQSAAALIISNEIKHFHTRLLTEHVSGLITGLLRLYQISELRNLVRTALIVIGKYCMQDFYQVLKEEVGKVNISREYPGTVLATLESFLHKHAVRSIVLLPDVIDLLLLPLNPKDAFLRKLCIEKVTDVLELLVEKLPMVAFEQRRQRLALGTCDHQVYIYDLKQGCIWKQFQGHQGPVNAVSFSRSGGVLATYSSYDMSLRFWKLEAGFLGLGHGSVKAWKTRELDAVFARPGTAKTRLTIIRLQWGEDSTLEVTREDGCSYQYTV